MARGSDASRTQIIVAIIVTGGAILGALIANLDKILPRGAPQAAPSAPVAAAPRPGADGASGAVPVQGAERLSAMQEKAMNANADALGDIAAKIEGASNLNIAGEWQDTDGFHYRFRQDGPAYDFVQLRFGSQIGSGEGRIDGRTVSHRFGSTTASGTCTGRIAGGGKEISGTCRGESGASWPFRITR
jgi:hypothetical protein